MSETPDRIAQSIVDSWWMGSKADLRARIEAAVKAAEERGRSECGAGMDGTQEAKGQRADPSATGSLTEPDSLPLSPDSDADAMAFSVARQLRGIIDCTGPEPRVLPVVSVSSAGKASAPGKPWDGEQMFDIRVAGGWRDNAEQAAGAGGGQHGA